MTITKCVQNCQFTCTEGTQESVQLVYCMAKGQAARKTDRERRVLSEYTLGHSVLEQRKKIMMTMVTLLKLVSWCFEASQPQRIISELTLLKVMAMMVMISKFAALEIFMENPRSLNTLSQSLCPIEASKIITVVVIIIASLSPLPSPRPPPPS